MPKRLTKQEVEDKINKYGFFFTPKSNYINSKTDMELYDAQLGEKVKLSLDKINYRINRKYRSEYDIFNIHDFYYANRNFVGNRLQKAYGKNFKISPNANPVVCDYFLERGDYLKLDMITLGYTLNLEKCRFIDRIRVYGTVKNVFTLTKFSGVDPSTFQVNGLTPSGQGSRDYYPSTRQFILGLNVDF